MLEILLSLLILIGAGFTLVGSLGLIRLRDFYSRLHAPTKASTLGVGSLLIASAVFFSYQDEGLSLHEVLVTLFLFITAPVGAHLMAKAALHLRLQSLAKPPADDMLDGAECPEQPVTTPDKTGSGPATR